MKGTKIISFACTKFNDVRESHVLANISRRESVLSFNCYGKTECLGKASLHKFVVASLFIPIDLRNTEINRINIWFQ